MIVERVDPTDSVALAEWDRLVRTSRRGSYCQLSSAMGSLRPYGFSFGLLVAREGPGRAMVAGVPFYVFSKWSFRLYSCPLGPLVAAGHEGLASPLLEAYLSEGRAGGAFFVQIQLAATTVQADPWVMPAAHLDVPEGFEAGLPFRTGNVPNQMLLVDLDPPGPASEWEETVLASFKSRTRRDIRSSLRSGLSLLEATSPADIRAGYRVIEENGHQFNYATRSWEEFGETLIRQVKDGEARVLVAETSEGPVGAHYGVAAGTRLTYMMGGTRRVDPDPKVGHFLQWHAMRRAHESGLAAYDLTTFGNGGVRFFKEGFQPREIPFVPPRFAVLDRSRFRAFFSLYPRLRRNKRRAAQVVKALTRSR